ncbi:hypothetical protein [Bacillus proteolyticus]|uniref:hypothetical protein n=1 Tax=Bacillus proteolyticus TaxID=2026192 RepID=UPI003CFE442F
MLIIIHLLQEDSQEARISYYHNFHVRGVMQELSKMEISIEELIDEDLIEDVTDLVKEGLIN